MQRTNSTVSPSYRKRRFAASIDRNAAKTFALCRCAVSLVEHSVVFFRMH